MSALDELFMDSYSPDITYDTPQHPPACPLEGEGLIGVLFPKGEGPVTLCLQTITAKELRPITTACFLFPAMHCFLPL